MPTPSILTLDNGSGGTFDFDPGATWIEWWYVSHNARRAYNPWTTSAEAAEWAALSGLGLPALPAADVTTVEAVRAATWRLGHALATHRPPPAAAVRTLNAAAASPPLVPQWRAGRLAWRGPVTWGQVGSELARAALRTAAGPEADRMRECGAADCGIVFLDTSRPGTRRWCSMQRCGNRAKQRAYRAS